MTISGAVPGRVTAAEVADALEDCCRDGVMLSEDGRYLSLALPTNPEK
jgi:hypothetical protein